MERGEDHSMPKRRIPDLTTVANAGRSAGERAMQGGRKAGTLALAQAKTAADLVARGAKAVASNPVVQDAVVDTAENFAPRIAGRLEDAAKKTRRKIPAKKAVGKAVAKKGTAKKAAGKKAAAPKSVAKKTTAKRATGGGPPSR
jgi:hypothetical protein